MPAAAASSTEALSGLLTSHRRLYLGDHFTMGNPESVSFNPVQAEVLELGIIRCSIAPFLVIGIVCSPPVAEAHRHAARCTIHSSSSLFLHQAAK